MGTAGGSAAGSSRAVGVVVAGAVTLAAISLALALTVAEGEARGHAFFHLLFAAVGLGLFVGVARMWDGPVIGSTSLRTTLLVLLTMGIAGAIAESIGASGYDRFNAGHQIEWLTRVHNAAIFSGAIGMLAYLAAVPTLIALAVIRVARRGRATGSSTP